MFSPDELVQDLKGLSPEKLRLVAAFVKELRADSSGGDARGSAYLKLEEKIALIFGEGLLGDFTWNIESDKVEAHPTVFRLYGAEPIAGPVPGSWFRARRHPDDEEKVRQDFFSQVAAGRGLLMEFRVNADDGVTRWLECRGVVIRDVDGVPRQVLGVNSDITARKQAELERRESEARSLRAEELLGTALHYSNTVVWRWNMDEDKLEWWGKTQDLYGVDAADLCDAASYLKVVFPNDLATLREVIARQRASGADVHHEFRIVRPGGELRWIASRAGMMRDARGRICGMTGVNFDVTHRKVAEEALKQSEQGFRELTNVVPQIVFTANASGMVDYHNERFHQIGGFPAGEDLNARWPELIAEEDRPRLFQAWHASIATGRLYEFEFRLWDSQRREQRWYLARAVPVRNADGAIVRWIGSSTDIHDQKTAEERLEKEVRSRTADLNTSLTLLRQREEQLEKSLHEKDALLREIHHRVKNNLQIISSLLSMQAANAVDSAAMAALRDSERRISSMAKIHEQLYGTDDMQTVEFADHARWLSQSLIASMAENSLISCRLDLEPVVLPIHQAIPCALILNELLTNSLKYAYPNERGGEITVHLSSEQDLVTLTVSDQGIGLPSNVDPHLPKTLGHEIVQVLVQQLEGELVVIASPGASFSVVFRRVGNGTEDHIRSAAAAT